MSQSAQAAPRPGVAPAALSLDSESAGTAVQPIALNITVLTTTTEVIGCGIRM